MFTTELRANFPEANRKVPTCWIRFAMACAFGGFSHAPGGYCRLTLGVLGCALAVSGHCQVYVGASGTSGSIVLSNFPTQETPDLLLPGVGSGTVPVSMQVKKVANNLPRLPRGSDHLRGVVESVALSVDIAPQLIHAVISAESNYNVKAVSPKGAMGLMQLMPATAKRFGVEDPFVIEDNILAGASYLKWLMGYFGGDIELVLAAYNAGEQAVVRAGRKVPKYPETQAYVRRIMADLRATQSLPNL